RLSPSVPTSRLSSPGSLILAAELALFLHRPGSPYHRLVRTACAAAGFQPEQAHQSREWETGASLVSAGLGVALIPRLARLAEGFDVVRVPLRGDPVRSEEHTSELQSRFDLVCRLLLEK